MQPRIIRVTGQGRAEGAPEVCRATLVATAVGATVVAALEDSEDAAARMRAALAAGGVDRHDATTAGVSIEAEEEYSGEGRPRLVGYRAEHRLAVVLRDLPGAGALLGEAIAAGGEAVRLRGVCFAVEDHTDLRDRARAAALADARHAAEQLAALTRNILGPVVSVEAGEHGGHPLDDGPVMAAQALARESVEVGLEPGAVSVGMQLTVVWELR